MMKFLYLKNSFKNLYRSKMKTLFFMILVIILTIISCISLTVWVSVDSYLNTCDEYYTTIGLLEYMSADYPNEEHVDIAMQQSIKNFDFNLIKTNEHVISFDKNDRALGYIDGYIRHDNLASYKDNAVIISSVKFEVSDDGKVDITSMWGIDALYCASDVVDKPINLEGAKEFFNKYAPGSHERTIIFYGEKTNYGRSFGRAYSLVPVTQSTLVKNEHLESRQLLIEDITGKETSYTIDQDTLYSRIAQTLYVSRHSVNVIATDNIIGLLPFNQEKVFLDKGRYFTADDYNKSEKVCIISDVIAKNQNLTIGSKLPLSLSIMENTAQPESYWQGQGFDSSFDYEIVGIVKAPKELNKDVYITKDLSIDYSLNHIGYTIGTIEINNTGAEAFYNDILDQLPEKYTLTIYDQGYGQAAKPLEDINRIAALTAMASLLATILVMFIYSYLYVYRQKIVLKLMMILGTGKAAVYQYFLFGMLMVSVVSVSIGIYLSNTLFEMIKSTIDEALRGYEGRDLSYSNGNLSIIKNLKYNLDINYKLLIFVGIGIILLTVISCVFMTYISLNNKKRKKKIWRLGKKHRTSTMFNRHFKYTYLSMIRSGLKTLLVIILLAGMIVFIGQLTQTIDNYEDNISTLKTETKLAAQFTDISGRQVNKVNIEAFYLSDILDEGYIDDYYITRSIPYYFLGISQSDGKSFHTQPFTIPSGGFAAERYISTMKMGPKLTFTNNIEKSPEFYYANQMKIEYLDGYDGSVFNEEDANELVCVIPKTLATAQNIQLGDYIKVYRHFESYHFYRDVSAKEMLGIELKVVGVVDSEAIKPSIYCPMNELFSFSSFTEDPDIHRQYLFEHVFDSCSIVLKDSNDLDDFRKFLTSYGFSEGTRISTYRSFIVINDKSFISTLDTLNQQLENLHMIYPILYVLVGITCFTIAFLVLISRQRELSIMRGLGASISDTFITFFTEQVVLSLVGWVLGLMLSYILFDGISKMQVFVSLIINGIYLTGAYTALMIMNKNNIMKILKVEE